MMPGGRGQGHNLADGVSPLTVGVPFPFRLKMSQLKK
jgi:hypothetical protein